jgi:hypothetical protein
VPYIFTATPKKGGGEMKIALFVACDVSKAAEVAKMSDQISNIPGRKRLAQYLFQGMAFAGLPPNTLLTLSISEFESNEALTAVQYPMALAGATTWAVPVLEIPSGESAKTEKKFKK